MTRPAIFILLSALAVAPLTPAAAQDLLWTRQIGTPTFDGGNAVAVDMAGNAYVTGSTTGSLGSTSAKGFDAFLAKYDASGSLLWIRQTGASANDVGFGVAVDGAGNAYFTGYTDGSLGGTSAGLEDAFLIKYDASGTLLWTRQIGTPRDDACAGVAVDAVGNAYIAGSTYGTLDGTSAGLYDAFLAKYDASGTLLWTRQIGTPADDSSCGVAVDGAGNAYMTGITYGSLGGPNTGVANTFLAKYSASGTLLWTRQFGTKADYHGNGVAVDGVGNAYMIGTTDVGVGDVFLVKYNSLGDLVWTRQIGSTEIDWSTGVAADSAGNAYLTGYTIGSLGGPNTGGADAFLIKYDASGAVLWTRQMGTTADDFGRGTAVDAAGNAYITGNTRGSLGGPYAGQSDVFLAKYGPPPCPADFDRNGFVNGDDFDAFVLAFVSGDAAADFDGNGFVTGDDFDAYVAAFEAGC